MSEIYRNHPAVIVKNTASFAIALILISVSMDSPLPMLALIPMAPI